MTDTICDPYFSLCTIKLVNYNLYRKMSYYSTRVVIQWHAENCDIVSSQRNSDVRNFVSTFVSQQHHWETVVATCIHLCFTATSPRNCCSCRHETFIQDEQWLSPGGGTLQWAHYHLFIVQTLENIVRSTNCYEWMNEIAILYFRGSMWSSTSYFCIYFL